MALEISEAKSEAAQRGRRFLLAGVPALTLVLTLVVTLGMAALGSPAMAQKTQTLNVGLMRIMGLAPIYSGIDQGFFKEEGLELKITAMRGGSVILPAISGGSLDIGFTNVISAYIARDQGFDYTAVAGISYENRLQAPGTKLGYTGTSAVMVPNDSPIKTWKDLEGKTFGLNNRRNIVWLTVVEMMQQHGADPSTMKWHEVPFPRMAGPLKLKQIDAIFQVQPLVVIYQKKHQMRIIDYPFSSISKKSIPISFWIGREKWAKGNMDRLNRFRRAQRKAIAHLNATPGEPARVVMKHMKMSKGLASIAAWNRWSPDLELEGLQWMADLALKWKLLDKRLDVKTMIAP